jgi:hypothetical protein
VELVTTRCDTDVYERWRTFRKAHTSPNTLEKFIPILSVMTWITDMVAKKVRLIDLNEPSMFNVSELERRSVTGSSTQNTRLTTTKAKTKTNGSMLQFLVIGQGISITAVSLTHPMKRYV